MDRNLRHTRQGRQSKSRTSNACEACKRRKTKCSGGPSPCDVCKRADTFCNFNPKLDTRRKLAYNSTTIQDRQQFMLTALLQTIKHSREDDLEHLISLIRGPSRPDAVATSLRRQFSVLQNKGIIPLYDIDETDVISFGLQGLCGHRKGKARPKSPKPADESADQDQSPTAMSFDSRDSCSPDDENFSKDSIKTQFSSPISIGHDDPFDPIGSYDTNMLEGSASSDFFSAGPGTTLNNLFPSKAPPGHYFQQPPPSSTRSRTSVSNQANSHPSSATTASSMDDASESYLSGRMPSMDHYHHHHHSGTSSESYPVVPSGSHEYMMQYYHAIANGLPTTLSPSLALKVGHQHIFPHHVAAGDEYLSGQHYAVPPLRSNA